MRYNTTVVADRHLLEGMARGDAEALRALHDRHSTTVYALAYAILVDPRDAEEVVAETFAHVWRAAARFIRMKESVSAWLKDMARSRARGLLLARDWPNRLSAPPRQGAHHTMMTEVA